ncbi:SAP-like protein BP-73 isoform X2 [Curcuma longa]
MPHQGKCLPLPGVSRGAIVLSYSCNRGQKLLCGIKNVNLHKTRISLMCNAGPNNFKRNPDFSRRQRGSSRGGKSKQYQEPEQSDNMEEMDYASSKNGSLLSLTGNIRHQATPLPGQREKEIVELFRKVQAQLRERALIKEGKKIEAAQQGQNERGTVDSLLKLLRKHSVNQKKKSTPEVDFVADQLEKNSTTLDDEQNLNPFAADDIDSDSSEESTPLVPTRPASSFRRKSPVPRVKFQPVFSAEEEAKSPPPKSQGRSKKISNTESELLKKAELLTLDDLDEESESSDNQVETSDSNSTAEKIKESSSATEASADLGSLKVAELRDLAKARGAKGYSKLKKGELIELLGA